MMTRALLILLMALTVVWIGVFVVGLIIGVSEYGIGSLPGPIHERIGMLFISGVHLLILCGLILKANEKGFVPVAIVLVAYYSFYAMIASHGAYIFYPVFHILFSIVACAYYIIKIAQRRSGV